MLEEENNRDERLKRAFKNVKEDYLSLKKELETVKEALNQQNSMISDLKQAISSLSKKDPIPQNSGNTEPMFEKSSPTDEQVSTGNKGVMQLFNNYSTIMHSTDIQQLGTSFGRLPRQEFLTFLVIYQLEDDLGRIGYPHIANHLGLSEGCIRTYVASLIKKGYPVKKERFNNKIIFLRVPSDFRNLDLKSRLFDLYSSLYQSFPFPQDEH